MGIYQAIEEEMTMKRRTIMLALLACMFTAAPNGMIKAEEIQTGENNVAEVPIKALAPKTMDENPYIRLCLYHSGLL